MRISPAFYNTEAELDAAAALLQTVISRLRDSSSHIKKTAYPI